jgi:hypothetical protein
MCLTAAVLAIANESVSWYLGVRNLLRVMNICLNSVAPTLFLLFEARFGLSTLQKYEEILRNQLLRSQLSILWRLAIGFMLVLPLGLSVAYKAFQGGESARSANATIYTGNISYYGMIGLPGVQSVGQNSGILLFTNSTLSFL